MLRIIDCFKHSNFLYGIAVAIDNDVIDVQWFGIDDIQRYYSAALTKVIQWLVLETLLNSYTLVIPIGHKVLLLKSLVSIAMSVSLIVVLTLLLVFLTTIQVLPRYRNNDYNTIQSIQGGVTVSLGFDVIRFYTFTTLTVYFLN